MFSRLSPLKKHAKIDPVGKEDFGEHINLSNYIAHDVDPIITECVIFLLCNRPRDVIDAMIGFMQYAHNKKVDPTLDGPYALPDNTPISTERQKIYFNGVINPVLKKLLREVSVQRPAAENVTGFMCDELIKLKKGETSLVEDKSFKFHEKKKNVISKRPSTTDGNFSSRQASFIGESGANSPNKPGENAPLSPGEFPFGGEYSIGGNRPKTTGRFVAVPDFVDPVVSADGHIEDVMFFGGQLHLQILHAEKYSGGGGVFGLGRYKSYIDVMCGDKVIKRSEVSAGALDDEGRWAGYASEFGTVILTPELGSSIKLMIYDCDREHASKPLGSATLIMDKITKKAAFECTLPIETNLSPGVGANGEPIPMDPDTLEGDSLDIDSLINVGQLTIAVEFEPYGEYLLETLTEDVMDVSHIRSLGFGFGWEAKDTNGMPPEAARRYIDNRFTAALCMFDAEGKFLDGVDDLQRYSRKGPPTYYRRVVGSANIGRDVDDITVHVKHKSQRYDTNKCFVYFLLFVAKEGASLEELESLYFRVKDGHSKVPYGRYTVNVEEHLKTVKSEGTPSAIILARVWRSFTNSGEWIVKPYGSLEYRKHRFGMLIPSLKNNLGADLVPGCQGTDDDRIAFVTQGEVIDVFAMSAVPVEKLSFGANWDPVDGQSIDLDLGCLMLDAETNVADFVSFRHLTSNCGSISHGGDARDDLGGDGDDEQIHVLVNEIPPTIQYVAFFITCFDGKPLKYIDTCSGHLFESETKRDLVMCDCVDENIKNHTAVLLCILYRAKGHWLFLNASVCADGAELHDNLPYLQKFMQNNSTMREMMGGTGTAAPAEPAESA